MPKIDDIENGLPFLAELYAKTGGDPASQISMYDIGEQMGLDRDASSKTAEALIGSGFAEVKTLSGGIGITEDGVGEAHRSGCGGDASADSGPAGLGDGPTLDAAACGHVEQVVADCHLSNSCW